MMIARSIIILIPQSLLENVMALSNTEDVCGKEAVLAKIILVSSVNLVNITVLKAPLKIERPQKSYMRSFDNHYKKGQ